jgi:uncharacterized LabA/DUF88 family protein
LDKTYAYIDGAFFRERSDLAMRRLFGVAPDLDFNHIRNVLGASRLFYYDCIEDAPRKDETEEALTARTADQRKIIEKVHKAPMTHIRLGTLKQRQQGRRVTQKEVDVTIAVDMFKHATSRVVEKAVLVTGDLDFRPVVESLVQLGVVVELVYDPLVTAAELQQAADIRRPLNADTWLQCCSRSFQKKHPLPQQWAGHSGTILRVIATGTCVGREVRICESVDNLFIAVFAGYDEVNDLDLCIKGPDFAFLVEKYIPMTVGPIEIPLLRNDWPASTTSTTD